MDFDEDHNEVFAQNVSRLISSVIHSAFTDDDMKDICIKDNILQDKVNNIVEGESVTGTVRHNKADGLEETESEEERIAYFRQVRENEYNKFTKVVERERFQKLEMEGEFDEEFQQNINGFICRVIDTACGDRDMEDLFTDGKSLTEFSTNPDANDLKENTSDTTKEKIEETESDEERKAYFKQVKESEYNKLVNALEREKIRTEEKLAKKKQEEELVKQFECFYTESDTIDATLKSRSKEKREPVDIPQTICFQKPKTDSDEIERRLSSPVTFEPEDQLKASLTRSLQENDVTVFENRSFGVDKFPLAQAENSLSPQRATSEPVTKEKKSVGYQMYKMNDEHYTLQLNLTKLIDDSEFPEIDLLDEKDKHLFAEVIITPITSDIGWYGTKCTNMDYFEDTPRPTPRPTLNPFFSEADFLPLIQHVLPKPDVSAPINHVQSESPSQVLTEKQESRNVFSRVQQWFRKNLFSSCSRKYADDI